MGWGCTPPAPSPRKSRCWDPRLLEWWTMSGLPWTRLWLEASLEIRDQAGASSRSARPSLRVLIGS